MVVDEDRAAGAADIAVAGHGPDPALSPKRPAGGVGHELVSAIRRIGGMDEGTAFPKGLRSGEHNWINCNWPGEDNGGDVRAHLSPTKTRWKPQALSLRVPEVLVAVHACQEVDIVDWKG